MNLVYQWNIYRGIRGWELTKQLLSISGMIRAFTSGKYDFDKAVTNRVFDLETGIETNTTECITLEKTSYGEIKETITPNQK